MSTPFGRSVLVAAAIAALLSGCAAPAPAAAPEPPKTTAATPSTEPEPPAEFACADLDDAMPAGFEAVDPFGSAPVLAAFAAGGSSCLWQPAAEGGAVSSIGVEAAGALVFLSINDRRTSPDAASIDEAATAIAEAIATAIDARG